MRDFLPQPQAIEMSSHFRSWNWTKDRLGTKEDVRCLTKKLYLKYRHICKRISIEKTKCFFSLEANYGKMCKKERTVKPYWNNKNKNKNLAGL